MVQLKQFTLCRGFAALKDCLNDSVDFRHDIAATCMLKMPLNPDHPSTCLVVQCGLSLTGWQTVADLWSGSGEGPVFITID